MGAPGIEALCEKLRLHRVLDHFSAVVNPREQWWLAYPLPEVLLLMCGTIASCDDYDDIVDWGEAHLAFLRRFPPYFHGVLCADWLRTLMNRVDPEVFLTCVMSWVRETWPDAPKLIAIEGKTSRRSHDRGAGKQALHLVSAFATIERLVVGQDVVADESCEQNAIPTLLERLAAGALVTIDAIACNPTIADVITGNRANFVLAVTENQPSPRGEITALFAAAPVESLKVHVDLDKDHGRIETRRCVVSHDVSWMKPNRRYPGEYRFVKLAFMAMAEATREVAGRQSIEPRYDIASAPLDPACLAQAVPGPLAHREQPSLGARCGLSGRPLAPAQGL